MSRTVLCGIAASTHNFDTTHENVVNEKLPFPGALSMEQGYFGASHRTFDFRHVSNDCLLGNMHPQVDKASRPA